MLSLFRNIFILTLLSLLLTFHSAGAAPQDYFKITVVDDVTGRGIPLVELRTTNNVRYYTDSNGVVAFNEPGLWGQNVFLSIKSHGYEYPADNFGYRGKALKVTPGGGATIQLKRVNIAERLYRITGEGIYRDSILTGQAAPTQQPLLNGLIMGQDTVEVTPYHGKLYWFWGDTDRPSYPLGNFATTGATSELPGKGGLDPNKGVNLTYFTEGEGFAKKMIPLDGPGPVWVGGLMTVTDKQGAERLITHFTRIKNLGEAYEQGLAIFNDQTSTFERLISVDLKAPLCPDGHPLRAVEDGKAYYYWGGPYPTARVQADMEHLTNPKSYEAFTCLVAGSRYDRAAAKLDRAADGHLIYGWKADTDILTPQREQELIKSGQLKPSEALLQLRDVETGNPVEAHAGSVFWNAYRSRWVMIGEQTHGTSLLGELWFCEADTPVGPWVYARKIITHDKYTFYNPTQHPYFDQDGGRLIYFEGTYTDFISGVTDITPRYNYNQIMYRLALDDPRLALPAPVYEVKAANGPSRYALRETVAANNDWLNVQNVAFFVLPPSRPHAGMIALHAPGAGAQAPVLGYGLPLDTKQPSPDTLPLYEYQRTADKTHFYSIEAQVKDATHVGEPFCRVWRNPMSVLGLDSGAR